MLSGCGVFATVTGDLPENCDGLTNLFAVADLDGVADHPCRAWVEATHGRVGRSGTGSAVVVSNRTPFGAGVLVSATHILGAGWFGPVQTDITATVRDPSEQIGVARIELIDDVGFTLSDKLSPMFDFFNAPIAAEQNVSGLFDILPRHDFFFAAIDGQSFERGLFARTPEPITSTPPSIFDPLMLAAAQPPIADVCPGDLVLMMGYASGSFDRQLTAAVGRVLADGEAEATIVDLANAGDVEGDIAYESEVEMIIEGEALPGMSGGGIFDASGALVGVLVRASDPINDTRYVRAVRMTYATGQVGEAIESLPIERRAAVEQFWDASLQNAGELTCPGRTMRAE